CQGFLYAPGERAGTSSIAQHLLSLYRAGELRAARPAALSLDHPFERSGNGPALVDPRSLRAHRCCSCREHSMTRPAMPHLRCSPLTRRWIAQLSVPVFIGGCSAASAPPASPPVVDLDASEPRPGPDRSRLPEPGPAPRWQAPQPQILRLSNGL